MQRAARRRANGRGIEEVRVGNVAVRIYRGRHSSGRDRWRVSDHTTGERRLRDFYDRGAARAEAERIARLLANGEAEAASLTGKEAASYGRAVELLRPVGISLELAAATFAEAVSILGGDRVLEAARYFARHRPDKITPRTVAEAAAELVKNREASGKSRRYVEDLRARLGCLAEKFACPVSSVTTAEVQSWLDGLGVAPRTARNYRDAARTLFAFAEARGYLPKGTNPVEDTEPGSRKSTGAITIYSASEAAALLASAPKDALPALALCAFAGVRTAEVQRLRWEDIDLKRGWITVAAEKAKTASRRLVPVLEPLRAWLAPHVQASGPLWSLSEDRFTAAQQEASERSGVPWKTNAFRHTWISARLATTHDVAKVAIEAGNSAEKIFSNYRELMTPEQAFAWFAIRPSAPVNVIPLAEAAA